MIWAVRNVAIVAVGFTIILLLIMYAVGIFPDTTTAVLFSVGIMPIPAILLIPGLLYEKISQSTVEFEVNRIKVFDRCGRCWREISYSSITDIRINEVTGYFYGTNKHLFCEKHICFFLNDATDMPDVSYAKLFKNPSFFMIGYQEGLLEQVRKMVPDKMSDNFLP